MVARIYDCRQGMIRNFSSFTDALAHRGRRQHARSIQRQRRIETEERIELAILFLDAITAVILEADRVRAFAMVPITVGVVAMGNGADSRGIAVHKTVAY